MPTDLAQVASTLTDEEIVQRILAGDTELYQVIVRRYNRRLYRVTWAILQNQYEAEDVIQETYVRAYQHLTQFAGRSLFSTWLTRIAVHEAWGRVKHQHREREIEAAAMSLQEATRLTRTPEHNLLATETRTILENAINALPDLQRSVFLMRCCEQMSTAEVASCLQITEEAVRMRFSRARQTLRCSLSRTVRATVSKAFDFLGEQCDRVTINVLRRLFHGSPG